MATEEKRRKSAKERITFVKHLIEEGDASPTRDNALMSEINSQLDMKPTDADLLDVEGELIEEALGGLTDKTKNTLRGDLIMEFG